MSVVATSEVSNVMVVVASGFAVLTTGAAMGILVTSANMVINCVGVAAIVVAGGLLSDVSDVELVALASSMVETVDIGATEASKSAILSVVASIAMEDIDCVVVAVLGAVVATDLLRVGLVSSIVTGRSTGGAVILITSKFCILAAALATIGVVTASNIITEAQTKKTILLDFIFSTALHRVMHMHVPVVYEAYITYAHITKRKTCST